MKYRTTIKEIKDNYSAVQHVPYGDLQHLLTYDSPVAYTCGVYGWKVVGPSSRERQEEKAYIGYSCPS